MLLSMPGGWLKGRATGKSKLLADKVADWKATPKSASKLEGIDRHRYIQTSSCALPQRHRGDADSPSTISLKQASTIAEIRSSNSSMRLLGWLGTGNDAKRIAALAQRCSPRAASPAPACRSFPSPRAENCDSPIQFVCRVRPVCRDIHPEARASPAPLTPEGGTGWPGGNTSRMAT